MNQHRADQIDLTMTPLQVIAQKYPGDDSYEHMQKLQGHLSSCVVTAGNLKICLQKATSFKVVVFQLQPKSVSLGSASSYHYRRSSFGRL